MFELLFWWSVASLLFLCYMIAFPHAPLFGAHARPLNLRSGTRQEQTVLIDYS